MIMRALFVFVFVVSLQGMDLPLPPVRLGDPRARGMDSQPPLPDQDDGDDPSDTPPPVFYGEQIDTETDSIIYVIDVSGSMAIGGLAGTLIGSRLARAQAELIASVNGLPETYRFNAFAYQSVVYDCFKGRVQATPKNKAQLAKWILNFNASGYTATGPAVASALSDRENLSVVLLTDGMPNSGISLALHPNTPVQEQLDLQAEAHRRVIREANRQGATIDVFGIQATGRMRSFCQSVAADSGGRYYDLP